MLMLMAALLVAPAAQDPSPAGESPDLKIVCRSIAVTGSRVHNERVCKTRAEWVAYRQEARRHVEQIQNQRGTAVLDNDQANAGKGGI